jgi:hypothetical protein
VTTDNPKPQTQRPAQAQSHEPVSEAYSSRRRCKMRPAAVKTFGAHFGSWVMSWMGSISRSTRALEIPTTNYDSYLASAAQSPLIPSMRAWDSSSSADRSHPSGGCRSHSCSSASITSCTSRSVSYRQRRI